jgi:hypothetical protein
MDFTAEGQRLQAADHQGVPWRRWGPYLSDRQWGTVGEDRPATVPGRPGPPPSDGCRRDAVPAVAAPWPAVPADRRMLARGGPRLAMIDAR